MKMSLRHVREECLGGTEEESRIGVAAPNPSALLTSTCITERHVQSGYRTAGNRCIQCNLRALTGLSHWKGTLSRKPTKRSWLNNHFLWEFPT